MANLKEIRKRITSVKKTQKTTSAMKMVSAAKLRRAQEAIEQAGPYSSKLKEVVSQLSSRFGEDDHPLFRKSEGQRVAVVLIGTDRGLCGGFNTNLFKALLRQLAREGVAKAEVTTIGRKARDYMKRTQHSIVATHTEVTEAERPALVASIVAELSKRFEAGEVDRVLLAYGHFQSAISQEPMVETLLPIEPPKAGGAAADDRETLFEPSAEGILDGLLRSYVENRVQTSWLDSTAGEHGSRMTAMDNATKNAGEMIEKLQLYYNRTRQAAITRELIEIISGAESL